MHTLFDFLAGNTFLDILSDILLTIILALVLACFLPAIRNARARRKFLKSLSVALILFGICSRASAQVGSTGFQTGQPNFVQVISNYTGIVLAGTTGTNFNNASNQIVQHITLGRQGANGGDTWYWSGAGSTTTTTNTYVIYFATAAWGTGLQFTNANGVNTNFTTGNIAALTSGASQNYPLSWAISMNGTNIITVKTNFAASLLNGDREIYPVVATNNCSGNVTNNYLLESHPNTP